MSACDRSIPYKALPSLLAALAALRFNDRELTFVLTTLLEVPCASPIPSPLPISTAGTRTA